MARYPVPAKQTRTEIKVLKSRFIATIAPVFSVAEAKAFVARIRAEFANATHNVAVYIVGYPPAAIAHSNDDGEPSGSAGRPALAVLQGSGLGDAAVVITRYYGGTKLGSGGLVRAYSEAVRTVLAAVTRAERVPSYTIMLATPYHLFEQVRLLLAAHQGRILDEDFAVDVTVTAQLAIDHFDGFQGALRELSRGRLAAEIVETHENTIMPFAAGDAGLRP